jgi:hypothetical protein
MLVEDTNRFRMRIVRAEFGPRLRLREHNCSEACSDSAECRS